MNRFFTKNLISYLSLLIFCLLHGIFFSPQSLAEDGCYSVFSNSEESSQESEESAEPEDVVSALHFTQENFNLDNSNLEDLALSDAINQIQEKDREESRSSYKENNGNNYREQSQSSRLEDIIKQLSQFEGVQGRYVRQAESREVRAGRILFRKAKEEYKQAMEILKDQKNSEEGRELLLSSANKGFAEAQYEVGRRYLKGEGGFSQHFELALLYLRDSAHQNNFKAQHTLGIMHREGLYFPKSLERAYYWFYLSVQTERESLYGIQNKREFLAQKDLDDMKQIFPEGIRLFEREENLPIPTQEVTEETQERIQAESQEETPSLVDWNGYRPPSFKEIKLAAEQGDPQALYAMGMKHLSGLRVPKDLNKSADYFRKAGEQNHAKAFLHLGMMHLEGLIEGDLGQARHFLERAKELAPHLPFVQIKLDKLRALEQAR